MGFTDLFKKTNYFDPKMNPSCSYCQFGKRSSEGGGRIFCEKKGMVDENSSCNKFVYSPLKRIPVKQLEQEGALSDDEMYVEVDDSKPTAAEKEKEEAEAAAKAEAEAAAKAQAEAEAAAKAQAEAEAAPKHRQKQKLPPKRRQRQKLLPIWRHRLFRTLWMTLMLSWQNLMP